MNSFSLFEQQMATLQAMNDEDMEDVARAIRPMDIEDDEDYSLGLTCKMSWDQEQERPTFLRELMADDMGYPKSVITIIWDDPSTIDAYFTMSGEDPVIDCVASQQDRLCRLTNEQQAPDKEFYSAAGSMEFKTQHSNFIKAMLWLSPEANTNPETINLKWKVFWKKYYAIKKSKGGTRGWLLNKQVNSIICAFAVLGQPKAVEMMKKNSLHKQEVKQQARIVSKSLYRDVPDASQHLSEQAVAHLGYQQMLF